MGLEQPPFPTHSIRPDDSVPMEVDYVGKSYDKGKKGKKGKDAKGKVKGKETGKTKQEGKGTWKFIEKGKNSWEKGPGRKGKSSDKGGAKGKTGGCFICGKTGHVAKECWKRVQQ